MSASSRMNRTIARRRSSESFATAFHRYADDLRSRQG